MWLVYTVEIKQEGYLSVEMLSIQGFGESSFSISVLASAKPQDLGFLGDDKRTNERDISILAKTEIR